MKIIIVINTDNDDFANLSDEDAARRVLKAAERKIYERGFNFTKILDANGNACATVEFEQ